MKNIITTYRKYFMVSLAVYCISFVTGAFLSKFLSFSYTEKEQRFVDLFLHNYTLGIKIMIFGWISLGVVSIIYLGYNGIFLGAFSFAIIRNQGFKPVLTGIMPHGIIEVIAFLLFATIGFESLRYISILKLNSKSEQELTYKVEIIKLVSIFLFASILLAIAAWIESSISHV
ncbi:stage II sporulation protein M [Heyndrickxia coagulans]|uniref:stage II sporulation protein M n=1 Tax=Heyndrickxia coagulans TaxID=1398 RepID=UPI002E21FA4B|nr:stage II sporulation protein M [Heyndrickxia coagulans]MED4967449.1 stage II sporulation protein M [Heyndrickxia coagulans]